jgi:exonuclease SbcD
LPVRILHLADVHLGIRHKYLPEEKQVLRSDEILNGFTSLLQSVVHKKLEANAVIIAGDLFHSPYPEPGILMRVKKLFADLHEANLPVFMIPGNHDNIISPGSVYLKEKFPGTFLFLDPGIKSPVEISLNGELVHIYGMAYSFSSQPPYDEFRPVDKNAINIAVLHGSIAGNPEWGLHSQDVPLTAEKLSETGFDYIALGHYHNFKMIQKKNTLIAYPGTLEPLGWQESSPRQIVFAEFNESDVQLIHEDFSNQQKFYRRKTINCDHHHFSETEEIADLVIKNFADEHLIAKIILNGKLEFVPDQSQILAGCKDKFFHIQAEDKTDLLQLTEINRLKTESTIRGLAIRKLLHKIEVEEDEKSKEAANLALKILLGYLHPGKN